ncbi:MAG: hypothetical protein QW103_01955 [Candidatus Pacearchaeota archaeon]
MVIKKVSKAIDDLGQKEIAGKTIGGWAFVIGLVLAFVIAAFGSQQTWPVYTLLVLGLLVGFFNINEKEVSSFLLAAVAFMFTFFSLGVIVKVIPIFGESLAYLFTLINAFVAPAAAVVAFKALFAHAKN